jgi:RNA polymerase sigma-70 factor (ECF subfamily)
LAAAYDAHAAGLYRFALVMLGNSADAEDAVQQVFVKWAAVGARAEEAENYLRRAVRNECYRILEKRRERGEVGEEMEAILEPVDAGMASEEERRRIESALRKLPAEQREVVHLKVYEGMTFEEIGEVAGVAMNTAASRYRYAMEKLREVLK